MTVIPFAARAAKPENGTGPPLGTVTALTGTFYAPSGRAGTFTGAYRLERLLSQFGQLAAAGVFTGVLADADGGHVGTGSRRHTAAMQVAVTETALLVRSGPLDVNLLGFLVTMDQMSIDLSEASRPLDGQEALFLVDALVDIGEPPPSVTENMSSVVFTTAGTFRNTASLAGRWTERDVSWRGASETGG